MFFNTTLTWHDARKECQKIGGDLASITNEVEHQIINEYSLLRPETRRSWIGFKRNITGSFAWVDGTEKGHITWQDGEPNNEEGIQDCGAVGLESMLVKEAECDKKKVFTCKRLY